MTKKFNLNPVKSNEAPQDDETQEIIKTAQQRSQKAIDTVKECEPTVKTSLIFKKSLHLRYKKFLADIDSKQQNHLMNIIESILDEHDKKKGIDSE